MTIRVQNKNIRPIRFIRSIRVPKNSFKFCGFCVKLSFVYSA